MPIQSGGMPHHSHPFYMPVKISSLTGLSHFLTDNIPAANSIIMIVWEGIGQLEIDGELHSVKPGSILTFSVSSDLKLETELQLQGIWIEYTTIANRRQEDYFLTVSSTLDPASTQLLALSGELYSAWIEPDDRKPFKVQQLFTQFITELYQELATKRRDQEAGLKLYLNT